MSSKYAEPLPHVDLFQRGYDSFGQSSLVFSGTQVNAKTGSYYEAGVPSTFIQDGDLINRLNIVDGYLQSDNYVADTSGWRLDADGNIDAKSGNFRGDITGASGTFGGDTEWENVKAGTNENALNVGHGNVKIDGGNKRIIINDGTNDRCLFGYLAGKF